MSRAKSAIARLLGTTDPEVIKKVGEVAKKQATERDHIEASDATTYKTRPIQVVPKEYDQAKKAEAEAKRAEAEAMKRDEAEAKSREERYAILNKGISDIVAMSPEEKDAYYQAYDKALTEESEYQWQKQQEAQAMRSNQLKAQEDYIRGMAELEDFFEQNEKGNNFFSFGGQNNFKGLPLAGNNPRKYRDMLDAIERGKAEGKAKADQEREELRQRMQLLKDNPDAYNELYGFKGFDVDKVNLDNLFTFDPTVDKRGNKHDNAFAKAFANQRIDAENKARQLGMQADEIQDMLADPMALDKEMSKLKAELAELTKQRDAYGSQFAKEHPWQMMANLMGRDSFDNPYEVGMYGVDAMKTQMQMNNVIARINMLTEAKNAFERGSWSGHGFWNNVKNIGKGMQQFATEINSYTDKYNIESGMALNNLANKIERGEMLTDEEMSWFVTAKLKEEGEKAASQGPTTGAVGYGAPASLEYMVTMAINPAKGASKTISDKIIEVGVRRFGKSAFTKMMAKATGMLTEGAVLSTTLGADNVASDALGRMAGRVGFDDGGNVAVADRVNPLKAMYQSTMASTIESAVEMMGVPIIGKATKGIGKVATKLADAMSYGKMSKLLSAMDKSQIVNWTKGMQKATGWHNLGEEWGEENVTMLANAIIVGDNEIADMFDTRTQLEILGTCALISGVMSTANVAGFATEFHKVNREFKKAKQEVLRQFSSDVWASLDNLITNAQDEDLTVRLADAMDGMAMNQEQRSAIMNYLTALKKYQKFNELNDGGKFIIGGPQQTQATQSTSTSTYEIDSDITLKDEIGNPIDAHIIGRDANGNYMVESSQPINGKRVQPMSADQLDAMVIPNTPDGIQQSEVDGYNMTDANQQAEVSMLTDNSRESVATLLGVTPDAVDVALQQALGDNPTDAKIEARFGGNAQVVKDYMNNVAKTKGMSARLIDDIADATAESDRAIDAVDNNGNVVTAKDVNGNDVNVVSGNIVTYEDGQIDVANSDASVVIRHADGTTEMVAPTSLTEVVSMPTEQAKATQAQAIAQQKQQAFADAMSGALDYSQGQQYTMLNADGSTTDVTILADNGDGNVTVTARDGNKEGGVTDGKQIVLPKSQIQQGVREFKRNQLRAESAQQTSIPQAEVQPTEVAEPTQEPSMPTDDQGNIMYEQMDADSAWDALLAETGGDADMAMTVANEMIADKAKAVEEASKMTPEVGATPQEKIANLKAVKQAQAQAQAELDTWKAIAETPNRRMSLQAEQAESQGQQVASKLPASYRQVKEESTTTTPQVGLVEDARTRTLGDKTRKMLDAMAKRLGLQVEFVDEIVTGKDEKGRNTYANADIVGNKVRIAWDKRDQALDFLLGHEFTHRMQNLSPEAYAEFVEATKQALGEEEWNKRINRMKSLYKQHGIAISEQGIIDEVVADYAGELVEERGVFDNFVERNKDNRGLLSKIADVLRSIKEFFTLGKQRKINNAIARLEALIESASEANLRGGVVVNDNHSLPTEDRFSIPVYHGSGVEFSEFDHTHMGEGEGNQAFGWGTYVTEVKGIAKMYAGANGATMLTYKGNELDTDGLLNQWRVIKDLYDENKGRLREMRNRAERILSLVEEDNTEMKQLWQSVVDTLKQVRAGDLKVKPKRYIYNVEIPDNTGKNYLDYYDEMPKKAINEVRNKLESILAQGDYKGVEKELKRELDSVFVDGLTASDVYGNVSAYLGGDKQASEFFNEMGYVGIKYPTNSMSSNKQSKDSNYVIFKESDAKIIDNKRFSLANLTEEEQSIVDEAKANGTYLKAPNGKASNLNERQWIQVRTKAFKDWFGDWENDPENASKVVDENGEPKVVYHGGAIKTIVNNNSMFFMTDNLESASTYSRKAGVTSLSNNVSMPKVLEVTDWKEYLTEIYRQEKAKNGGLKYQHELAEFFKNHVTELAKSFGAEIEYWPSRWVKMKLNDGSIVELHNSGSFEWSDGWNVVTVLENMQRAFSSGVMDENTKKRGNFAFFSNMKNPLIVDAKGEGWENIRFDAGDGATNNNMGVDYGKGIADTNLIAEYAFKHGYDGTIITNINDSATMTGAISELTTDYIAFEPTQIKSATDNVGTFDASNPDIRYSLASDMARDEQMQSLLKNTPLWNDVAKTMSDADDYTIAVEVLNRLDEDAVNSAKEAIDNANGVFAKADATDVANRLERALQMMRSDENAEVSEGEGQQMRYSLRTKPEPKKTIKVYKLFNVDENGNPQALFIDAANSLETGVWYDADSPTIKDLEGLETEWSYLLDNDGNVVDKKPLKRGKGGNFVGLPSKAEVNKATQEGQRWMTVSTSKSGEKAYHTVGINGAGGVSTYALRPGWHATNVPSARHIGVGKDGANAKYRGANQRWFEIEISADVDYNEEARERYLKAHPTYSREKAYSDLKGDIPERIPEDGYYNFKTNSNANPNQDWYIAGAIKIVRPLTEEEGRKISRSKGIAEDLPYKDGVKNFDDSEVRYSLQGAFYSNARHAVEDIKQDKATPQQWIAMLKKNGGLKAGEDKWLGLEDWLNQQSGSVTKQDIIDYINENSIKIEEVEYEEFGSQNLNPDDFDYEQRLVEEAAKSDIYNSLDNEFYKLLQEERDAEDERASQYEEETGEFYDYDFDAIKQRAYDRLAEIKGEDFKQAFKTWSEDDALVPRDPSLFAKYLGLGTSLPSGNPINSTRLNYTTRGLDNKREIALTIPTIDPYNIGDEIHFGDAGDGRAVAWIRFGETEDAEGNRVLVIDEIQSKRHQDGREKGYSSIQDLTAEQQENGIWHIFKDGQFVAPVAKWQANTPQEAVKYYARNHGVPSAPFEKNWQELAMKRMLRYATDFGFDKLAWTTGEQQAKRYGLGEFFDSIVSSDWGDRLGETDVKEVYGDGRAELQLLVDRNGVIVGDVNDQFNNRRLDEVVGKEIADKLLADGKVELSDIQLRLGGEGMKGFYDKMLPSFMNKYGKKWGVKVGEVTMPNLEEGYQTMHSVDVTDAMREDVRKGQPLFSLQGGRSIADKYEKRVNTKGKGGAMHLSKFNFMEATQDGERALKEVQRIIEQDYGIVLESYEDAYKAENALSSVNQAEWERYIKDYYEPMMQIIDKWILKGSETEQSVNHYLIAKSGLERNREFTVRDAFAEMDKMDRQIINGAYSGTVLQLANALRQGQISQDEYNAQVQDAKDKKNQALENIKNAQQARVDAYRAERDALREQLKNGDITYEEFNQLSDEVAIRHAKVEEIKDYSGLTALAKQYNEKDWRNFAEQMVVNFENKHDNTDVLWERINNATKKAVEKSYESGITSKEAKDHLDQMFLWYVPMGGMENDTAEDIYSYLNRNADSAFTQTVKRAEGHSEHISDDVMAMIANTMQSAILQGNRNKMKQKFLNMVENYPTDLFTLDRGWVVMQGNEWVESHPEIKADYTAEQVRDAINAHNEEMRNLEEQGLAMSKEGALKLGIPLKNKHNEQEHAISVMRNGQKVTIYVNGNPRVAQALNGKLKDVEQTWIGKAYGNLKRYFSASKTSWNPDFVSSNFSRDIGHSTSMTFVRHGVGEWGRSVVMYAPATVTLVAKALGKKSPWGAKYDQYFDEFVRNGGVTGYSHLYSVDDWKIENTKRIDRLRGVAKAIKAHNNMWVNIAKVYNQINSIIENSSRFNEYARSRNRGEDVATSVWNAKEITLNFNKKGSSKTEGLFGGLAFLGRNLVPFFNPIMQGIYQFLKISKEHKRRMAALCFGYMGMGFFQPFVNAMLVELLGGGDEDDYMKQPEYTRRTNFMLYTGDGYIKIPLAQIFREFYGIGDVVYCAMYGKLSEEDATSQAISQVRRIFSLDDVSTYFDWVADIATNTNFMGNPLWKENDYNKYKPEYTKAYDNTWSFLVSASKWINEALGGDEHTAPEDFNSKWINPAIWQRLLSELGGGALTSVLDVYDTASALAHGEDVDWANVPIAKRLYTETDEETLQKWIDKEYFSNLDNYKMVRDRMSSLKSSNALDVAEKIDFMYHDPKYLEYVIFDDAQKEIKELRDLADSATDDNRAEREKALYDAELEVVEAIDAVRAMEDNEVQTHMMEHPEVAYYINKDIEKKVKGNVKELQKAIARKEPDARKALTAYRKTPEYKYYNQIRRILKRINKLESRLKDDSKNATPSQRLKWQKQIDDKKQELVELRKAYESIGEIKE